MNRAGGFVEVPLDQFPKGNFRIAFANEIEDSATLLDAHIDGLRQALARRASAERTLSEVKRLKPDATSGARSQGEILADAKAEHERAQAQVQYARERLEQLADDCSNDVQAAEAQLDHMRGRLQVGQIKREQFTAEEEVLARAKTDLTKARALVVRALNANGAEEVPRARGTFVARLAHGKPGLRAPVDAWVAWSGAALVLAALFVPVTDGKTALQLAGADAAVSNMAHWFVSFPIAIAVAAAAVALIPRLSVRGLAYCAVWLLGSLLAAAFLHESNYMDSPASEALRIGGPLLLRPGILVYSVGLLAIAAAAFVTLIATKDGRVILPLTAIASVAGLGAVVSDMGGVRVAKPELRVESQVLMDGALPSHQTTVTVVNTGGRELLLARDSTAANAYNLQVERRIGRNSGIDVSAPISITIGQTQVPVSGATVPRIPVLRGQAATFVYRLTEGEYRASIQGIRATDRQERTFSLEALTPASEASPDEPTVTISPDSAVTPEVSAAIPEAAAQASQQQSFVMEALSATATLRGVVAAG
ncbi:MAG TPA: hypothetical protein PK869_16065, partial [Candidatus Hydrogenedentes bacterium]|nr:hypothetical protein [Candidatus Hydrogenedentota bacterium]